MKLTRTFVNWYSLLATIGHDFNQLIGSRGPLKHTGQLFTSLLFMRHLTLLFSDCVTPIVWSLNPKGFVFNELLLTAGFMSALTAIVLTVMPAQQTDRIYFRHNSSLIRTTRLFLGLGIPLILLILLDHLVRIAVV